MAAKTTWHHRMQRIELTVDKARFEKNEVW